MLDEELAGAYADALARSADPNALRSGQRVWLRDTRDACADAVCLKAAYEARIGALEVTGGVAPEGVESTAETSSDGLLPKYVVIESKEPDICTPLLYSLNTSPPHDGPAGVAHTMRNEFMIDPWESRGWRWMSYGVAKVYYWDAVFLDINNDGREDAVFRMATSLKNRDHHESYIVISVTPEELAVPMPEEHARLIIEGDRALQTRVFLGGYLSFTELVSLGGEVFVMTGYGNDWWAEGRPARWWIQLLRIIDSSFQRVCFFKAKK